MKFTSLVYASASGSVGGLTYSHNRNGMYTRARSIPVNPDSPLQVLRRSQFAAAAAAWKALSSTNRDAWNLWSTLVVLTDSEGRTYHPTGEQAYVASRALRAVGGLAAISAGPVVAGLDTFTIPTPTVTAPSTLSLAYTTTDAFANEVGGAMLVFASRPQPASRNFFAGPYQYAGKITGAGSPPASPVSLTLPFVVAANDRVFFRFRSVRADGRFSAPFRSYDDAA